MSPATVFASALGENAFQQSKSAAYFFSTDEPVLTESPFFPSFCSAFGLVFVASLPASFFAESDFWLSSCGRLPDGVVSISLILPLSQPLRVEDPDICKSIVEQDRLTHATVPERIWAARRPTHLGPYMYIRVFLTCRALIGRGDPLQRA